MRQPPYDQTAEKAVIGSILLDNSVFHRVMSLVNTEDFYVNNYRIIMGSIVNAMAKGAVDQVTLGGELKKRNVLTTQLAMVVSQLTDDIPTSAHAEYYAKIVRDKSIARGVIAAASKIVEDGYAGNQDIDEYLSDARNGIGEAVSKFTSSFQAKHITDGMQDILRAIANREENKNVIKTGFQRIDDRVGGVPKKVMTIIAGRPSMGKSSFTMNLMLNMSRMGHNGLVCSLEDSTESCQQRFLGMSSGTSVTDIMRRKLSSTEFARVGEAASRLKSVPLYIIDRPMTAAQIENYATVHQLNYGLDYLVVDHLGFVSQDRDEKEYEFVSKTCRRLTSIAKNLGIPVIAVVQLNRDLEKRPLDSRRPQMSDLRGSGRLEEDARNVWMLYRDAFYNPDTADPHDAELLIRKSTNGPTGMIRLYCDMRSLYFCDAADREQLTQNAPY